MIKAVIFDIGGVLRENLKVKSFWKNKRGSRKLRHAFGTGKLSNKEFIKKGTKLLDLSEKEFLKQYKKAYSISKIKKNVFSILRKIKVKKYILSDNNAIYTSYEKKEHAEIFKEVDRAFLSQNIGMRKDKVQAFKFVIKRIKTKPEEAVMIDDENDNLKNARKLGMKTILFKNSRQLKKDLKKLGINI